MQHIKSKDTEIELLLRKELWRRGLRYRVNCRDVIGKPDILFPKKKVAVFCDSEFWHGYDWENRKETITTNRSYWISKIERNIERDLEVTNTLISRGYIVLRFWGFEIKNNVLSCADIVENSLHKRIFTQNSANFESRK